MRLLTPYGYKDIADVNIGDELVAYDIADGHRFNNVLEGKQWFSPEMFQDEMEYDEEGNPTDVIVKTKEEIFAEIHGELKAYVINDTYVLFKNQSVWANLNVVHAQDLKIGDVIYDDDDNDVLINSVSEVPVDGWWRLTVSGDHSYISDNLTLHNASRYWVGGGASANWNATANTNWATTSGGSNNASVPTSTDDVFFDGNGNSNSTISASIIILSLTIDSGYTATMTHNAALTVAGNVTLGANYTIAGTSAINISAAATITSNGKTWPNSLNLNASVTFTLVGNLVVSGTLSKGNTGGMTINKTTNEKLSCNGLSLTGSTSGTADIYLTGGTWSGAGGVTNNLFIDGNVTISGTVFTSSPNFTYVSGAVTTTGSTVNFQALQTITSGSIIWNNLTFSSANTKTIIGDLNVNGLFTSATSTGSINKTTSEVVNLNAGLTMTGALSGTADIYLKGGTWSGSGSVSNNLYIDGNVTISGSVNYGGANFTYLSGVVTTGGSTVTFNGSMTITTRNISWWNITFNGTGATTKTLIGNLNVNGLFSHIGVNHTGTINKTTNEVIFANGGIALSSINSQTTGDADIYLQGGSWTQANSGNQIGSNLYINGNVTLSGTIRKVGTSSTMKYLSGVVNGINANLTTGNNLTIVGFDKIPLSSVTISTGTTITMDRFFTGTPSQICAVTSTGANYTIQFTDGFEKIGRNVAVSGATIANRGQLLLITNPRFNTNRQTNIGIRYINQSPNGFAEGLAPSKDMAFGAMGLAADPCFQRQG